MNNVKITNQLFLFLGYWVLVIGHFLDQLGQLEICPSCPFYFNPKLYEKNSTYIIPHTNCFYNFWMQIHGIKVRKRSQ